MNKFRIHLAKEKVEAIKITPVKYYKNPETFQENF